MCAGVLQNRPGYCSDLQSDAALVAGVELKSCMFYLISPPDFPAPCSSFPLLPVRLCVDVLRCQAVVSVAFMQRKRYLLRALCCCTGTGYDLSLATLPSTAANQVSIGCVLWCAVAVVANNLLSYRSTRSRAFKTPQKQAKQLSKAVMEIKTRESVTGDPVDGVWCGELKPK